MYWYQNSFLRLFKSIANVFAMLYSLNSLKLRTHLLRNNAGSIDNKNMPTNYKYVISYSKSRMLAHSDKIEAALLSNFDYSDYKNPVDQTSTTA
jgi:hypothetical protein